MKKGMLMLSLSFVFTTFFFGLSGAHQAVEAAPLDGTDPVSTGCANSAITVESARIDPYATIELRYSTQCETAWARITASVAHDPGNDYGGNAKVVRNSDGRSYSCEIPAYQTSCFTSQVNDSGVTSFAEGTHDVGAHTYRARTAAY
ncbi:Protein of unknown function [Melghirimyces thermohalophilus]|uniref:DUF2690 domain-containing protein n=2 Tax=Melghirimyces thermohalophilus TaxID=1236220 RepID=A0A1G6HQQ6_9BACL|nr:Protein of unknown function [Melghirimyces thermohalophilus]